MKFKEHLEKRFSVRNYLPREVEKETLEYILECARLAPSASNKQPWLFYVVTSQADKQAIQESYNREWFRSAPVYIVVCGNYGESWKRASDNKDHCDIDVAITAEHIMLATEHLGLGTCWVCNFNEKLLSSHLNLPDHIKPLVIFPIGYVDEENAIVPNKKRKSFDEIVKWL